MMEIQEVIEKLQIEKPKVHCLTNPVTMQDVANVLLAAGGTAIMAQNTAEVEEITSFCRTTYLNTGVPDAKKFQACILAGKRANALGHPVILDPVGVGASRFRQKGINGILADVHVSAIRCNQEEAHTLLRLQKGCVVENIQNEKSVQAVRPGVSGGVESAVSVEIEQQKKLAEELARICGCTVLISGKEDVVSDGKQSIVLSGGDDRIRRITGSGCMLSALCALFCGTGIPVFDAVCAAGQIWKECSREAGIRTDNCGGGIGSFRMHLFDVLDQFCNK